ncbi:MAG TPA: hypothetical protein VFT82_04045 [Candidatus Paceibacterota bacterium]|nr:hypothetical protein [Candidatus Paceibacterota bacterium]
MKIKYRIMSSRPDEAPELQSEPTFEGDSVGECDRKAKEHLEEIAKKEWYAWDTLELTRIDVGEKTTTVASNRPEYPSLKGAPRVTTIYPQKVSGQYPSVGSAPRVLGIFISPAAGAPMQSVRSVHAIAGRGLEGDRYCDGKGSFQKGELGKRQVTLMNARFFPGSGYEWSESRRNIVTEGVELLYLIGREFTIGTAVFRGVKYNDPCERPKKLSGKTESYKEAFVDCGCIIAEIVTGGSINVGDSVISPPKGY